MTNEEILEGNKLIAEFIGGKISIHRSLNVDIVTIGYEWYFLELVDWDSRNLQYHSSWDWLMPVCAKIKHLSQVGKYSTFMERKKDVLYSLSRIDISLTFAMVIRFIKWYNIQNK